MNILCKYEQKQTNKQNKKKIGAFLFVFRKPCFVCNSMGNVEDYLEHFYFYCKSVKQLWNEVNSIIQVQMGKTVTVSHYLSFWILYGKSSRKCIYKLIIIGELCISKFKYGNHPNLTMLLHQELRLRNIL